MWTFGNACHFDKHPNNTHSDELCDIFFNKFVTHWANFPFFRHFCDHTMWWKDNKNSFKRSQIYDKFLELITFYWHRQKLTFESKLTEIFDKITFW
jgi:hypothetical protein